MNVEKVEVGKMNHSWVVHFKDGNAGMKYLLGGKGANLAEMTCTGLPVPPGFTITTDACRGFYKANCLPDGLMDEVHEGMKSVELQKGEIFGNAKNPLLVSVRSGSINSMPGMMDTILNLGLNDSTVDGLARATNNEKFAYDCYRRLIQMFGNVVFGIESIHFESLLRQLKRNLGVEQDQDMTSEGWRQLVAQFKQCIERHARTTFPQDVYDQLRLAVEAVSGAGITIGRRSTVILIKFLMNKERRLTFSPWYLGIWDRIAGQEFCSHETLQQVKRNYSASI